MKQLIFICTLVIILSSCSGNKFLTRKYTTGRFVKAYKTIKHNTVYADTAAQYTSLQNLNNIKIAVPAVAENVESLNEKITTVKKDSIFHIKRKGHDKVIVVKNNFPDVKIYIDESGLILNPKIVNPIPTEKIIRRQIKNAKSTSILALCFSLVPVLGFIFAVTALGRVNKLTRKYPLINLENTSGAASAALVISIIPTLLVVAAFAIVVFAVAAL